MDAAHPHQEWPDDDQLLAGLRAALAEADPVPDLLTAAARAALRLAGPGRRDVGLQP